MIDYDYTRYLDLIQDMQNGKELTKEEKEFVSYMYRAEEMETEAMYSRESVGE